jgi:hypothetical protein
VEGKEADYEKDYARFVVLPHNHHGDYRQRQYGQGSYGPGTGIDADELKMPGYELSERQKEERHKAQRVYNTYLTGTGS